MVLEKIKSLRGLFYKKVKEVTAEQEEATILPGFEIKSTKRIVEFPDVEDLTKVNITYPLIEPFAYVNIKWDADIKEVVYNVVQPELSKEEAELLAKVSEALIEIVDVGFSRVKEMDNAVDYLQKKVAEVLKEFGVSLSPNQYVKIMYYIYRNFVGFNQIEALLQDPNIEDISCDGVGSPVYIIHRKYGSLKTNITFDNLENLREFVVKLAERSGRYVSYAEPILDSTLPDGSRISATLAGDVATHGPTFTIRKFSEKPFSPVEQMESGTVSSEVLAYYWYLVEHGASMLIVGGTATGKTSFLNSICMFIPPEAKIVSIEDTRELRIPHEHWIPGLARVGFGIPMPTGEKYGEVTLFDLLKESFRQNPTYVIVGETRGPETYVMFQGMASGHASLSTFHASSVDTLVKRLTTAPIELSPTLIESLNVVTIMIYAKEKGQTARRIKEIVEIESVDPKTDEVKTNVVFRWDPTADVFEKVNESIIVKKIVTAKGGAMEDVAEEMGKRRRVLDWMRERGVKDWVEVTKYINLYYKEPKKLFEMMGEAFKAPIKRIETEKVEAVVVAERPRRRSLLELLGFKIIRES